MTETYAKPLPQADEESREFYEGRGEHKLMLMRCLSCRAWRLPSRPRCQDCLVDGDGVVAGERARGAVLFGIMHEKFPGFAEDVPYNYAVVELEEGPRMVSNIVGVANEDSSRGYAAGRGLRRCRGGYDARPIPAWRTMTKWVRGGERPKPAPGGDRRSAGVRAAWAPRITALLYRFDGDDVERTSAEEARLSADMVYEGPEAGDRGADHASVGGGGSDRARGGGDS